MIKLLLSNGRALVWDIQDLQALRVQHHICGVLSGTLPQVGQQNVFLGLPLILMPEEVVLLLRNKIAVLVDDPKAHNQPTTEETRAYEATRQADNRTQQIEIATFERAKRSQMELLYKDVIGKRKDEKQKQKNNIPPPTELFDASPDPVTTPTEPIASTSTAPASFPEDKLNAISYSVTILANSSQLPWYRPSESAVTYSTIDEAKSAGIWDYPSTDLQSSRCKLFEDLWKRGFFMGGGLKFGGDFLIYPGDPLRYHSHFTLTVLADPETPIMPLDIVAYGRLATAVKKAHLMGSWNEKESRADYFSLEWAAIG